MIHVRILLKMSVSSGPVKHLFQYTLFFLLTLGAISASAQHSQLLYHMNQLPQSQQMNPGRIPLVKFHIGLPGLSGIAASAGNSGFSYQQVEGMEGSDNFFQSLRQTARPGLNQTLAEENIQLLSVGLRVGKTYFNLLLEDFLYANVTQPADLLSMFADVEQRSFLDENFARNYDLSQLFMTGASYRSYSLGVAHQLWPNLSVGARFRYLQGVAGFWTENNGLMFQYPEDGDFFRINGNLNLLTSGFGQIEDLEVSDLIFPGGNSGLAFDIGGFYQLNDQIELSFSTVNLGSISWKKDINYQVVDERLEFDTDDVDANLEEWETLADNLLNEPPLNPDVRFTSPLPTRFHLGASYRWKPNTSFGLLVSSTRYQGVTTLDAAISGHTRLGKLLGFSTSVGTNRFSDFRLGTGLSLNLGPVQIYAITDNVLAAVNWRSARQVQAQVGINLSFGYINPSELSMPLDSLAPVPEEIIQADVPDKDVAKQSKRQSRSRKKKNKNSKKRTARETDKVESDLDPNYFTLDCVIRDAANQEILEGVRLDVYRLNADGDEELFYTGSFYNSQVLVQLERNRVFQILINKPGYVQLDATLYGNVVQDDQAGLVRHFELTKGDTQPLETLQPDSLPETPLDTMATSTPDKQPMTDEDAFDTSDDLLGAAPTEEEGTPATESTDEVVLGVYYMTESTSLRVGPHHTTDVILRLRPGYEVEVLEQTGRWWWKVRYQDRVGYAKSFLMER